MVQYLLLQDKHNMSINKLTRTATLDQANVLNYTRIYETGVNQSVTELISQKPLYNNPYSTNSGAWRMLNLRVNKLNGYGSSTGGASLKFGFTSVTADCSTICGFTFGIPPLYAQDLGTISKSIAYGFALNPFGKENESNVLYIIHENSIINLGIVDTSNLAINVSGAQISYIVGTSNPRVFNMANTTANLYVVAALGHVASEVVNLSLAGGESFDASSFAIDYSKQIWVLCSGLDPLENKGYPVGLPLRTVTNQIATTNSQIRIQGLTTSTQYKVYYPWDETPSEQTFTTSVTSLPGNISNVPFVVRIELPSGLQNLIELSLINTAVGASSTLSQNESYLTGLKTLEIRSNYLANVLNEYFPLIGKHVYPPNLETLYLETAQETGIDLTKLGKLTRLSYLSPYLNHPETGAIPGLKILELSNRADPFYIKSSLENFRNYFENTTTGVWITWSRGRVGSQDIIELAIAKSSRRYLYTDIITRLTGSSFFSAWDADWNYFNDGFKYRGGLPWEQQTRNTDTVNILTNSWNLTNPTTLSLEILITTSSGSETDTEISRTLCVTNPSSDQEYLRYFSIRKISNTNYKIFRKISGNTVRTLPNSTQIRYVVALEREKNDREITGILSNATTDSYGTFHTLTVSGSTTAFNDIKIGDTVCLRNRFPSSFTNQDLPSVVVKKEVISGNSVATIRKGNISGGTGDGIGDVTGESRTYHFSYEFRLGDKRKETIVNTFATAVANSVNYTLTVSQSDISEGNIAIGSPVMFYSGSTPTRPEISIGEFTLQTSRVTAISNTTVTITKGGASDGFLTLTTGVAPNTTTISQRTPASGTGNFLFNYCFTNLVNPVGLDSSAFPSSIDARIYSGNPSGHDYVFY